MRNDYAYQIDAPHFCAGIIVSTVSEEVRYAAPILKYMTGWTIGKVEEYCKEKGWKIVQT